MTRKVIFDTYDLFEHNPREDSKITVSIDELNLRVANILSEVPGYIQQWTGITVTAYDYDDNPVDLPVLTVARYETDEELYNRLNAEYAIAERRKYTERKAASRFKGTVYALTTYTTSCTKYDGSWSGTEVLVKDKFMIYATREAAERKADELNLTVVDVASDYTQATISEVTISD
jgi:hypothetical protein